MRTPPELLARARPSAARVLRIFALLLAAATFGTGTATAAPMITEVMASNNSTVADEDGDYSDWLELHNPDATAVNLGGWHVTDSADNKTKWTFPANVTIPANGYLIVWASNKNRGSATTALHTNFALSSGGEYVGLINPEGTVISEFDPGYPPLSSDTSYGVTQPADAAEQPRAGYFAKATPGARNGGADTLITLGDVMLSPGAGAFAGSILLQMTGAGAGETIRYTLTPPHEAGAITPAPDDEATEYTGPVVINSSVIVKAAVFKGALRGPVSTAHYVRIEDVGGGAVRQFSSQLPIIILDSHGLGDMVRDDIDRPGWMHVFDVDASGRASLAQDPSLSTPMEFKIRGSTSAEFPKKGYNVELKRLEGGANHVPLLGMREHDRWAVIAPWFYDRSYARNSFVFALSNSIGRWAPDTRFAEAFVNTHGGPVDASDYHGIVIVTEQIRIHPHRVAITDPVSGATTEPEVTGGYIIKIDGRDPDEFGFRTERGFPAESTVTEVVVARPKVDDLSEEQRNYVRNYIQDMEDALFADLADNYATRRYLDYIDRDSWVDFHLLQVFSGNADALWRSAYFHKDRGGKLIGGPQWDFDRAGGSSDPRTQQWDIWTLPGYGNESGAGGFNVWTHDWWGPLARDPEFMQSWIDRWQTYRQGPFSDENLTRLAEQFGEEIGHEAAVRDATRWPDNTSRFGDFAGEIQHLAHWMRQRAAWIDAQFVAAPTAQATGGRAVLTPPAGRKLVYTLDGSDPRALNGAIAPGATVADGPVEVDSFSDFRVRTYDASQADAFPGSPWSRALSLGDFTGSARLINVSSRAFTGAGENVLIAGLYVAGPGRSRFLIRGVGPTLEDVGIDPLRTLSDPVLRVVDALGNTVAENHNWSDANAAQLQEIMASVGAFNLAVGSKDAALVTELDPGAYTVIISNAGTTTGISLAEIYQVDRNSSRPVNLSTRARVRAGDEQLIGGIAVNGDAPKRFLVRAIGPGLQALEVADVLADPVLFIHHGQDIIATSDDWEASPELLDAMSAVGAFALEEGSRDAALIVVLPPGNYTARVSGKNGAEGVALVEVYELP